MLSSRVGNLASRKMELEGSPPPPPCSTAQHSSANAGAIGATILTSALAASRLTSALACLRLASVFVSVIRSDTMVLSE